MALCHTTLVSIFPLIADMQQAQLMMVGGFVMLGWVLVRRQIRLRKRVNRDARAATKAIKAVRNRKEPAVPLCDAPVETQRWQAAMFDLQRELKADLDTRIVVVQTLLRQVDERIQRLVALESSVATHTTLSAKPPSEETQSATTHLPSIGHHQRVQDLLHQGHTAKEIAAELGLPIGEIELTIATIQPG